MTLVTCHGDEVRLSRGAIRFPVELIPPVGFRAEDAGSWPVVEGRLEYVDGRLLYLTPCGDRQGSAVADIVFLLKTWSRQRPEFVVRTNEAGMRLGSDVRAADAAVWRREDLGPPTGGYHRVSPVLAVEVAGLDERESDLRHKAHWYLSHGVQVVWIVLPETQEAVVLTVTAGTTILEHRCSSGDTLPPCAALPGLIPVVNDLFSELG